MPRLQPICLVIAVFLMGCKSASNGSSDGNGPAAWFGNSIPSQTEPELEGVENSEQSRNAESTSDPSKPDPATGSKGNLLTRWFQGVAEKSASPRRIPLPLSAPDSQGDDGNVSDF